MPENVKLVVGKDTHELPLVVGTEKERGVNIRNLRETTGLITFDDGYGNTGSCESKITFIDGEQGILRYRGIPIDELAEKSTFLETAWLLIYGELPDQKRLAQFRAQVLEAGLLPEAMCRQFEHYPPASHPMAMLSSALSTLSCFNPEMSEMADGACFDETVPLLIGNMRTIAAFAHKALAGQPFIHPRTDLRYAADFLSMMFSLPNREAVIEQELADALDLILVLHADHEQNCSTSTVRMVASARANIFASLSAGVDALWGPLHGGANQEVISMLEEMQRSGQSVKTAVARAKDKDSNFRLYGFGHRVYKNFDPRAKIIKAACDRVLAKTGRNDPLLDLAKELEEAALADPYFIERKLYPNVDFYSGIIMRALGIPVNMFTVIFAMGRLPGWIAHWREVRFGAGSGRIYRPRQIYQGPALRSYDEARPRE